MKHYYQLFILGLFLMSHLSPAQTAQPQTKNRRLAHKIAHRYPMVDGHVDLPYRLKSLNFRLQKEYLGIPIQSDKGEFDYVKAKKGGLSAPFMSIFVPSNYQREGGAKELADSLIKMIEGISQAHPDKFALAKTPQDIAQNFRNGLISLPLGMENGAPIEDKLANVSYFFNRGVRYITLTHVEDNLICDSSNDKKRTWGGLSAFGREVVAEMNRLGMLIDISHVSDETFFQVMELSKSPCIASHSSCRTFTPDFPRNMSDAMIKKLAQKGGVIMISFGNMFLDNASAKHYLEQQKQAKPLVTVKAIADHIDHVVKIAGVDYVGFGSDFDGVGDYLPEGIKTVAEYPNLIFELLQRGYTEKDIAKMMYQNIFRVWNEVIAQAQK
ncbi:MAG: dipeptidase [Microscillaceae bacterium]|jgi:membrane dipeptidase|nr:dipeptidase [Microscillaceae bacterium]